MKHGHTRHMRFADALEAAENSNQAGEDFVVAAAAGQDLLVHLQEALGALEALQGQFDHVGCTCTFPGDDCCGYTKSGAIIARGRAAITKATGGKQ